MFQIRTTKPGSGNKYYITKSAGGYSNAIVGKPADGECNVLANCVGYAYGRFNEIGGYGSCKYLAPVNAENFIQYKGSCEVGQTPKVGAVMVWQKGASLSGSDGAGHVAIVERVDSATQVYTSESGYGSSKPFWNSTRNKGNGNWGAGSGYKFLGFIYNPAVKDEPAPTPAPTPSGKFAVGDVVTFTGTTHYANANAASGVSCKPGKAKVTQVYPSGKHPYHLIKESGGGSTVYGWVNTADISGAAAPTPTPQPAAKVAVGSMVKVRSGAKSYTGQSIASWVYSKVYRVDELKGARAVLDVKGLCTAFNVTDLILQ